jgi:hypothetical protein
LQIIYKFKSRQGNIKYSSLACLRI